MLEPGSTFDRYTIEALLGQGGWGRVFRAVDTRLRRKVALKVLLPERAADGPRLLREARAAAAFQHPNVVSIFDMGEANGTPYIAMELVEGEPLSQVARPGAAIGVWQKIAWLADIARALAAAHRAGVLHRDVKPQNVMVTRTGTIKILDFGLAKPVHAGGSPGGPESAAPKTEWTFQTRVGYVVGTPRYMAPEALAGEECDGRADQYAWGVVAFELLSGAHPRLGAAGPHAAPSTVPPLLSQLVADVPFAFAVVVARAVAYEVGDRFPDMGALVADLDALIQGEGAAAPSNRSPTVPDTGVQAPLDLQGAMTQPAGRVAPLPTRVDPPATRGAPAPPRAALNQTLTTMDAIPWHRPGRGATLPSPGLQPPEPRSILGPPAVVSARSDEPTPGPPRAATAPQGTIVSAAYAPAPPAAPPAFQTTMQSSGQAPPAAAYPPTSPPSGAPPHERRPGPHGTSASPVYAQGGRAAYGQTTPNPYPPSGPTQISAGIAPAMGLAQGSATVAGPRPGFRLRAIHVVGAALAALLLLSLLVGAYLLGAAGHAPGRDVPAAPGAPLDPRATTGATTAPGEHALPLACDAYLTRLAACGPAGPRAAKTLRDAWAKAGTAPVSCDAMDRALDRNPMCAPPTMPGMREPPREPGPRPGGRDHDWNSGF